MSYCTHCGHPLSGELPTQVVQHACPAPGYCPTCGTGLPLDPRAVHQCRTKCSSGAVSVMICACPSCRPQYGNIPITYQMDEIGVLHGS